MLTFLAHKIVNLPKSMKKFLTKLNLEDIKMVRIRVSTIISVEIRME